VRAINTLAAITILSAATAAYAHTNVKNAAVKARMDLMGTIAGNMKVLGDMAKGARAFDAGKAQVAASAIAEGAGKTPALFKAQEDDPKSEAKPAIWQNFADFTAKAAAMEGAASQAAGALTSVDALRTAVGQIGATCGACHKVYRE